MNVTPTELPGVLVLEPRVYHDDRGFFFEAYRKDAYRAAGIETEFVQDNQSSSRQRVLRGLHLQSRMPQAKLVRAVEGAVFDVVVDVREHSPTFRRFVTVELSADNLRQVFVPAGYAHGIYALSPRAEVVYKVDAPYDPGGELTILWNDPELAIPWPDPDPILSAKDRAGLPLSAAVEALRG